MRRPRHALILRVMMLCILLAFASCRQKDLFFPEAGMGVMEVRFDWTDAPDAAPEGMTLWFFSLDEGGAIWRFDIAGPDGGPVELPYGRYAMLSCNNDIPAIRISDTTSPTSLTASLRTSDSIAPPIIPLYRASVEEIEYTPDGLAWTENGIPSRQPGHVPKMLCHPMRISTLYDIVIKDIDGLERVQQSTATFHGVCRNLRLLDAQSTGQTLDIQTALETDGGAGPPVAGRGLAATFRSFGPLPDPDEASLEVAVTLKDRHTYRKTFPVGQQIANRPDRFYVKIVIDTLSIPDETEPPDDDVGMEVEVDGWTIVNIDYTTGP